MDTESDAFLQGAVDEYLGLLRAGDFDSAFHGLTDLPPAVAVPLLETPPQHEARARPRPL